MATDGRHADRTYPEGGSGMMLQLLRKRREHALDRLLAQRREALGGKGGVRAESGRACVCEREGVHALGSGV